MASKGKIAALVADAFQEEEYFFPKVALTEADYQVEVVSLRKEPVEIYSYFTRTGLLDVERAIEDARPERERLDEAQLVALTMIICWENVRSRFNSAIGLTPQGFKDRCEIPQLKGHKDGRRQS